MSENEKTTLNLIQRAARQEFLEKGFHLLLCGILPEQQVLRQVHFMGTMEVKRSCLRHWSKNNMIIL